MADDVSFVQEIDDSLRAERIEQFWQRNSLKIALLCGAILLATAASVLWKDHVHEERMHQTSLLLRAQSLAQAGKYEDAAAIYTQAETGTAGLGTLAKLRRAQALLSAGHKDTALAAYAQVANDAHADNSLRDLAALQVSMLNPAQSASFLAQAAQTGHPYAVTARQMEVANLLHDGKTAEARALLKALMADSAQPQPQRDREEELENMLDGVKP